MHFNTNVFLSIENIEFNIMLRNLDFKTKVEQI
jgi:hypothetical protein